MESWDELYERILENGPSRGTLLLVLDRLKGEGLYNRAIQECRKALQVFPGDLPIMKLMAEIYLEAGFLSKAESMLASVMEQVDDLISVYRERAVILAKMGRAQEACDCLERFLAFHPEDQNALELMHALKTDEEPAPTPEPMEEPSPPPSPEPGTEEPEEGIPSAEEDTEEIATPTIAEVYFKQGLIQEAIDTYEKILEQNPDHETAVSRLAELRAIVDSDMGGGLEIVEEDSRAKKEKVIAVLEGWLAQLKEKTPPPVSAT